MHIVEKMKPWLGRKSIRGAILIVIIVIVAVVLFFTGRDSVETGVVSTGNKVVSMTTPVEYAGGQSLSLIGNVRAFTEARVTSERAGRVVGVNVSLGEQVSAGAVVATLENASERASVLQAEGVYDAAVAAAAQSGVGVDEANNQLRNAKNNAVSTYKSAYNTTNGVVLNSIDAFFANPNDRVPGLRINGRGFVSQLNNERVAFQTLLPTWQARVNSISIESDIAVELAYASQNVQRTIDMIDTFLLLFNQKDDSSRYTSEEIISFSNSFTSLRSTLIGVQANIDNAETTLISAKDALKRSELAALGGVNSAADAQVKQALGSLRAAQANLAKTVLRTPISGTVNSLSIRTGDFINSFSQVAIVANNSALEVVAYLSDTERSLITEGDLVLVEGKYSGNVTEIAPAVDSATGKTEIRIATEGADIKNGDTVRIIKEVSNESVKTDTIRVPLTAIQFAREDGVIFQIEDEVLVAKPVKLGAIFGASVEISEGLSSDDSFVIDARGLVAGEKIQVKN